MIETDDSRIEAMVNEGNSQIDMVLLHFFSTTSDESGISEKRLHPAFAKADVYAALNGYLETFSPAPSDMTGGSDQSPESWLHIAQEIVLRLPNESAQVTQVEQLILQQRYQEARKIIEQGMQEAYQEIRKVTGAG